MDIVDIGKHKGDVFIELASGKMIAIETKEVEDFIASIMDKRLFNQSEGMRKLTQWAFVLHKEFHYDEQDYLYMMHKDGYYPDPHWGRKHVEGALTAVQARGVITRTAYAGFTSAIEQIINWVDTADVGGVTHDPPKLSPFDEHSQDAVNLLTLFEGVGIVQAKSFLSWAGKRPLYKYIELMTRDFGKDKPKGWTNYTVRKIRQQLGLPEKHFLSEMKIPEWHEELD